MVSRTPRFGVSWLFFQFLELVQYDGVWLGMERENNWEWDDGETSDYLNWARDEPSINFSCARLDQATGLWYGTSCSHSQQPGCQLYV